ncbi:MarR family transcriptional regulator [Hymenobacter psoromatis]|nr:MarR family transcriptional regulator [Hymenobacter psoromatis]
MDIFEELGPAALGSRLRRLTDTMTGQAAEVYRLYQVPFEPRWFAVFYAVATTPGRHVGDIAERIGQTHAAVSQVVKELARHELVQVQRGEADQRRSLVSLSEKGRALWPQLQLQTADVRQATEALLAETRHNLWLAIGELEYALAHQPLASRVKAVRTQRLAGEVQLLDYTPAHQADFKRLNVEWIERYFQLEAADLKALDHPDEYILQPGGHIMLAVYQGQAVGTCALLALPNHCYELAKMAVAPAAQGLGIGYQLGQAAIAWAKARGATHLYLESNTRLKPALTLYHKLGFQKTIAGQPSPYERCNIQTGQKHQTVS